MDQGTTSITKDFTENLYALRAGLSVLSQERDKMIELQKKLQMKCKTIQEEFENQAGINLNESRIYDPITKEYEYYGGNPVTEATTDSGRHMLKNNLTGKRLEAKCRSRLDDVKKQINKGHANSLADLKKLKAASQTTISQCEISARKVQEEMDSLNKFGNVLFFVLAVFLPCFIIGWLLLFLAVGVFYDELPQSLMDWLAPVVDFTSRGINPALYYLLTIAIVIGGIVGTIALYTHKDAFNFGYNWLYSEEEDIKHEIEHATNTIENCDDEIKKYQDEFSIYEKVYKKVSWGVEHAMQYGEQIEAEIRDTEERLRPIQNSCQQLYGVLQQTYHGILDERDWQYLDLVIFYCETGRAFTRQEALQQVDREVQTDRIIGSINRAANYISSTIRSATFALSSQLATLSRQFSDMSQDFKSLSASVGDLNKNIESAAANQVRQIEILQKQNSQLQSLVSSTNLSNALQEKANMTSEQLMNDIKYIRTYIL